MLVFIGSHSFKCVSFCKAYPNHQRVGGIGIKDQMLQPIILCEVLMDRILTSWDLFLHSKKSSTCFLVVDYVSKSVEPMECESDDAQIVSYFLTSYMFTRFVLKFLFHIKAPTS